MDDYIPEWAAQKIRQARELKLDTLDLSFLGSSEKAKKLSYLPDEVYTFTQLKKLSFRNNQIDEIPSAMQNLTQLEALDFSNNPISSLPDEIRSLKNLSSLRMEFTSIETLPGWVASFPRLKKLYISGTLIRLPKWISERTNWIELGLSYLQLDGVPEWISNQKNLERLKLSGNSLYHLPKWFKELTLLKQLQLSDNKFTTFPDSIRGFHQLRLLDLSRNRIAEAPNWIGDMHFLVVLSLFSNLLSTLPNEVKNLVNLSYLFLDSNQFETIPDAVFELKNLKYLGLGNAHKDLDNIYGNRIKHIPEKIRTLKNLSEISVCRNPIETPPLEIVNRGLDAIREYYRQQEEQGTDHLYEAKLLVVGEGGAGKTTLAKKIQDPNYQLRDEDTTKGIEVTPWSFKMDNGRNFRVNIWDFGGQEIYHATHQFFLTKRSLYALVADSRKEDTDFNYWLQVVELLSDGCPVLIIKNEKQGRARELNESDLRGRFSGIQKFLSTDLANNRGLPAILKAVQYYVEQLPHVGAALPKYWVRVREALEKDPHNYISLDTYFEICKQNGFSEEKDMLQLSGYLHDLGDFLHFQDDPVLRNTVILKPRWGTDAVYRVLDDETVRRNLGNFTSADLARIWGERGYARKQYELLQLMMKFRLAYQVPHTEDTYIAPHLLDPNQPEYDWDGTENLHLRYEYKFMPKGIITQFIVLMHEYIREHSLVWKSGVVLEKDGALAEVIEHYDGKEIRVRVAGKNKKALLDIVDYQMEEIHRSYRQLKYDTNIPCKCDVCKTCDKPWDYPLQRLKKFIIEGSNKIQCQNTGNMMSVRDLLFDIPLGRQEEERRERGAGWMTPDAPPAPQVIQNYYAPVKNINTGGGAAIDGNVDTGGGDFTGRDQINFQTAFDALRAATTAVKDAETREELETTLGKLEHEAGKGEDASEKRVKGYFSFLAEMAPDIWDVAVNTFINPIAGVSNVFQKVAQRARNA